MPPEETPAATGTAVGPAGTQAIVVHSDLRCPWAHVAVHRLLDAAERRGIAGELVIDHRWFPIGDDAVPDDPAALDRRLAPVAELDPGAGWTTWADRDAAFPRDSRVAAAWVQGAKAVSPQASTALDRALRVALFGEGRDIADEDVVEEVATGVPDLDVAAVRAEVASGRPDTELERQAAVSATDAVPASPTVVLAGGETWVNPGIEVELVDGVPRVDADAPDVYDEILESFLAGKQYD